MICWKRFILLLEITHHVAMSLFYYFDWMEMIKSLACIYCWLIQSRIFGKLNQREMFSLFSFWHKKATTVNAVQSKVERNFIFQVKLITLHSLLLSCIKVKELKQHSLTLLQTCQREWKGKGIFDYMNLEKV